MARFTVEFSNFGHLYFDVIYDSSHFNANDDFTMESYYDDHMRV